MNDEPADIGPALERVSGPVEKTASSEIIEPQPELWLDSPERGKLWLGHFQQLTTLTIGGAAGLLVLLQMGVMERTSVAFYVSLIACGVALILALGGQARVLDEVDADAPDWRSLREIRRAVFLSLGVAALSFVLLILG